MDAILKDLLEIVCITVVLPVSIVLIIRLTDKAKYCKKYSFLEKCVENGVELNPELLVDQKNNLFTPKAALKIMLLNRLTAGVSILFIGIGILIWSVVPHIKDVFVLSAIGIIAVGIGLLVWYFVGKKMLAEDLKAEEYQHQTINESE